MKIDSSLSKEDRYERLISLYVDILAELDNLHSQGLLVKDNLHKVIDRSKIEQVLLSIKNTNINS